MIGPRRQGLGHARQLGDADVRAKGIAEIDKLQAALEIGGGDAPAGMVGQFEIAADTHNVDHFGQAAAAQGRPNRAHQRDQSDRQHRDQK